MGTLERRKINDTEEVNFKDLLQTGRYGFKIGRDSKVHFRKSLILIASAPGKGRRAKGGETL